MPPGGCESGGPAQGGTRGPYGGFEFDPDVKTMQAHLVERMMVSMSTLHDGQLAITHRKLTDLLRELRINMSAVRAALAEPSIAALRLESRNEDDVDAIYLAYAVPVALVASGADTIPRVLWDKIAERVCAKLKAAPSAAVVIAATASTAAASSSGGAMVPHSATLVRM